MHLYDSIGNWVEERVDMGFRIGAPPQDGLFARRLFAVQLIVCAAQAYLARYGMPRKLDDLANHQCSVFRPPATGQVLRWYLRVNDVVVLREMPPAMSTNDVDTELEAVLPGPVVGQLSGISAASHIRAGRRCPCWCST